LPMLLAFRRVVAFRRHRSRLLVHLISGGNRTQMMEAVKLS
jgi:hypothetical protein